MKAQFNLGGDLVVSPETPVERFALAAWSSTRHENPASAQFVIDLTPPPAAPAAPVDRKYVKAF